MAQTPGVTPKAGIWWAALLLSPWPHGRGGAQRFQERSRHSLGADSKKGASTLSTPSTGTGHEMLVNMTGAGAGGATGPSPGKGVKPGRENSGRNHPV